MKDSFRADYMMEHPFSSEMTSQDMFTVDHDPAHYSTRSSPPWLCSEDSMSDGCSGTWSSPAGSVSYSPSPRPQDSQDSYLAWGLHNGVQTLLPYTSMGEVQYHPDATLNYTPTTGVCHQPYYQAEWQYPPQPDAQVVGGGPDFGGYWTSTPDYSRASSEQISQASSSPLMPRTEVERPLPEGDLAPVQIKPEPNRLVTPKLIESQPPTSHPHTCLKSRNTANTAFPCPLAIYGCASSFASKNEWKRHLNTQHLCLEIWRCDLCSPRRTPSSNHPTNDFNRKDLFVQHLRRMHCAPSSSPKSCPNAASKHPKPAHQHRRLPNTESALMAAERRCHVVLRTPPMQSQCLFCEQCFRGRESWAARVEHVARHLEKLRRDGVMVPDMEYWNRDPELETWLEANGILVYSGRGPQKRLRVAMRGR